jgi:hypothetical protein
MPTRGNANKDQVMKQGNLIYGDDGSNSYPIKCNTAGELVASGTIIVSNTETIQTEMMATRSVAASSIVASTILSLVGVKQATFFIDHGRSSSAAFGTQGPEYWLQASQKAAGNDTWVNLATFTAESTACLAVAASADVAAAATTIVITSGTSIPSAGNIVFWANTVAATASEWMRCVGVTGTANFLILDGLTNAQDSDTNIFTRGERWTVTVDCASITRARVVVANTMSGTTLAIYSRVGVITAK